MLDSIELRSGMQDRRKEHWENTFPESWPPIEVDVSPAGTLSLGDGNHRLAVARDLDYSEVPIRVRRIGREDEWEIWNEARRKGLIQPPPVTQAQVDAARQSVINMITPKADPFDVIKNAKPGQSVLAELKALLRVPTTTAPSTVRKAIMRTPSAVLDQLTPEELKRSFDMWRTDFTDVPHIEIQVRRKRGFQPEHVRVRRLKNGRVRVDWLVMLPG